MIKFFAHRYCYSLCSHCKTVNFRFSTASLIAQRSVNTMGNHISACIAASNSAAAAAQSWSYYG